jgi:hypothetical protein
MLSKLDQFQLKAFIYIYFHPRAYILSLLFHYFVSIFISSPKPVLLAVGEAYWPYEWVPSIVETQVLRVGNLYILGVPGELTTMSGRRLRKVVEKIVKEKAPGEPEPRVVIAGRNISELMEICC